MPIYKNIIIALELNTPTDKAIIQRAHDFFVPGVSVRIVHAVEHLSGYSAAYGISVGVELEELLLKKAESEIKKIGDAMKVPHDKCIVKFGSAKVVVQEEAEKIKADLIIVGSHGRSGIGLLLGSTANGVLHGAKCDVLAVRLKH